MATETVSSPMFSVDMTALVNSSASLNFNVSDRPAWSLTITCGIDLSFACALRPVAQR
jgi:hypothetical protein